MQNTLQSELKIPIGIQGLPQIIATNRRYIDKTPYISSWVLNGGGNTNIIHRPRRFGKTLTLSVVEALYSQERELFKGTSLPDSFWDKFPHHPVISFTLALRPEDDPTISMEMSIRNTLINELKRLKIYREGDEKNLPGHILETAIDRLVERDSHHLPVILIDEYDSLITYAYERGKSLRQAADVVAAYIYPLKYKYKQIYASYIIGIMKYQGLNLMSSMNNPSDDTLEPDYAQMIGFTMEEIQHCFPKEIEEIAFLHEMSIEDVLGKIKTCYNGYCFSPRAIGKTVYAGYSFCKFACKAKYFGDFWYSTGGINTLYRHGKAQLAEIENLIKNGSTAKAYLSDLEGGHESHMSAQIHLPSFLFYHGYLTIQSSPSRDQVLLAIPNEEVRRGFHRSYAINVLKIKPPTLKRNIALLELFVEAGDIEALVYLFSHMISGIPGRIHEHSEAYYQTAILMFLFCAYPVEVHAEKPVASGIPDLVIQLPTMTYLFELKFVAKHTDDAPLIAALNSAKEQVHTKRYLESYRQGVPVYATALVISQSDHNLMGYMILEAPKNNPLAGTIDIPVLMTPEKIKEMGQKRGLYQNDSEARWQKEEADSQETYEDISFDEEIDNESLHKETRLEPLPTEKSQSEREFELEKRALLAELAAEKAEAEKAKTEKEIEIEKAKTDAEKREMQMKIIFIMKKQNFSSQEICHTAGLTAKEWERLTGEKICLDPSK